MASLSTNPGLASTKLDNTDNMEDTQQTPDQANSGATGKPDLNAALDKVKSGKPAPEDVDNLSDAIQAHTAGLNKSVDTNQIDALQERAYDMQDKRASRNEWLQFANTLGNALARVGLGIAGAKSKTDLSGVQLPGEKMDFLADTDRGENELGRQLQYANQARNEQYKQAHEQNLSDRLAIIENNKSDRQQTGIEAKAQHDADMADLKKTLLELSESGKNNRQGNSLNLKKELSQAKLDFDYAKNDSERKEAQQKIDLVSKQLDLKSLHEGKQADKSGPVAPKTGAFDKKTNQFNAEIPANRDSLYTILSNREKAGSDLDYNSDKYKKDKPLQDLAKKAGFGSLEDALNQFKSATQANSTGNSGMFSSPTVNEAARASAFRKAGTSNAATQVKPQTPSMAPVTASPVSPTPPSASIQSGLVSVVDPKTGQTRQIPKEHVQSALSAGYTLAK